MNATTPTSPDVGGVHCNRCKRPAEPGRENVISVVVYAGEKPHEGERPKRIKVRRLGRLCRACQGALTAHVEDFVLRPTQRRRFERLAREADALDRAEFVG